MDMDTSLPRQTISSSLQAQTVHERRLAIAALLRRPLLTPGEKGASDFMLVRRHTAWLREWFMRHCQWTLHVESELARLRKTPGDLNDSTRFELIDFFNGLAYLRAHPKQNTEDCRSRII